MHGRIPDRCNGQAAEGGGGYDHCRMDEDEDTKAKSYPVKSLRCEDSSVQKEHAEAHADNVDYVNKG